MPAIRYECQRWAVGQSGFAPAAADAPGGRGGPAARPGRGGGGGGGGGARGRGGGAAA
ncbi:hypothetical protein I5K76_22645, partial [Pseudomonas aeruginosa]|nr:hypothetical protein [Pseudomonas aeruginosa]